MASVSSNGPVSSNRLLTEAEIRYNFGQVKQAERVLAQLEQAEKAVFTERAIKVGLKLDEFFTKMTMLKANAVRLPANPVQIAVCKEIDDVITKTLKLKNETLSTNLQEAINAIPALGIEFNALIGKVRNLS